MTLSIVSSTILVSSLLLSHTNGLNMGSFLYIKDPILTFHHAYATILTMVQEQIPQKPNQDPATDGSVVMATAALIRESYNMADSKRNLRAGQSYQASVKTAPLAEASHFGGNVVEGLTHLIVVGDSMIGVSHIRNTKKPDGGLEKVRVALLPVGAHAGAKGMADGTAKTIQEIDVAALGRPDRQGVIQSYKDVNVGRSTLAGLSGETDPAVSGNHFTLKVDSNGGILITDTSTNGTRILEAADYDKIHTGLSDEGRSSLIAATEALNNMPSAWEQEQVDMGGGQPIRVINPDSLY